MAKGGREPSRAKAENRHFPMGFIETSLPHLKKEAQSRDYTAANIRAQNPERPVSED